MAFDRRERTIENLAVASALGFLTLVVAAVSLFVDSRVFVAERELLAPAGTALSLVGRATDPCFDRIYRVEGAGNPGFAFVMKLKSSAGAALVAVRLSSRGEFLELRLLGSCSSRLPSGARELLASLPGAAEALDRAIQFTRSLIGASIGAKFGESVGGAS